MESTVIYNFTALFRDVKKPWTIKSGPCNRLLSTLIEVGIKFKRDDFQVLSKKFLFGWWAGKERNMVGEYFYWLAVESNNRSAAISFEKWAERKPFFQIIKDNGKIKKRRIAVGTEILWKVNDGVNSYLEKFYVTNIGTEYFIMCSYKEHDEKVNQPVKIKSRKAITRDILRKEVQRRLEIFKSGGGNSDL